MKFYGPDGNRYSFNIEQNHLFYEILWHCSDEKFGPIVYEAHLPWIKRTVGGNYKIKYAEGWRKFPAPLAGGFVYNRKVIVMHKSLPLKEKFAIMFHELGHILKKHAKLKACVAGNYNTKELKLELQATDFAISAVKKHKTYIKKFVAPADVIECLRRRRAISVNEKY